MDINMQHSAPLIFMGYWASDKRNFGNVLAVKLFGCKHYWKRLHMSRYAQFYCFLYESYIPVGIRSYM